MANPALPSVSVIVPVLDEAPRISSLLDALARDAPGAEVVVADGGSRDGTADIARAHASAPRVLDAPRGRARQMNAGAAVAAGDVLLFLHADSALPRDTVALVREAVAGGAECGCFGLSIESDDLLLRAASALITVRSRAIHSATGDQAIFATRDLFARLGGYPEWPLFEDMELVRRARRAGARWRCIPARVGTSARRWEAQGVARTILRMWALRLLYHGGADPALLARLYGRDVRESARAR